MEESPGPLEVRCQTPPLAISIRLVIESSSGFGHFQSIALEKGHYLNHWRGIKNIFERFGDKIVEDRRENKIWGWQYSYYRERCREVMLIASVEP